MLSKSQMIPEWIDIGLDVIGHLQAAALNLPDLADAYRGRITFLGGIDVQFNLVNGNRESIREEVRSRMTNFRAYEGKYIASPSNSIMPETPIENVWTLFDAIREFGDQHRTNMNHDKTLQRTATTKRGPPKDT